MIVTVNTTGRSRCVFSVGLFHSDCCDVTVSSSFCTLSCVQTHHHHKPASVLLLLMSRCVDSSLDCSGTCPPLLASPLRRVSTHRTVFLSKLELILSLSVQTFKVQGSKTKQVAFGEINTTTASS